MSLTPARKPKAYELKRHGSHHRQSKNYLKPYWPYIPIVLIIVVGFSANSLLSKTPKVLGAQSDYSVSSLLAETNVARSANSDKALSLSTQLDNAAQTKASDMAAKNYWSHISPVGVMPWSLIIASGYRYSSAGENLAYGFNSSDSVINAWLSSPEHRANLLDNSYSDVGFGVAESSNYLSKGPAVIVVAEYAEPLNAPVPISANNFNDPNFASVSHLQLFNSSLANWLVIFVTLLAAVAIIFLALNHLKYLKQLFREGEIFILHHASVDILVIAIFTFGIVFTRSAGFIG